MPDGNYQNCRYAFDILKSVELIVRMKFDGTMEIGLGSI
jgi:hypothetical protein